MYLYGRLWGLLWKKQKISMSKFKKEGALAVQSAQPRDLQKRENFYSPCLVSAEEHTGLWPKKSLPAWRLPQGRETLHVETPGGDSALKPGLLGLEIHSPLQFFWRRQRLSTSLNLEVHKIPPLASPYWWCADLAWDWDRTSGKGSLAHALGNSMLLLHHLLQLHFRHFWSQCYSY